MPYGKVSLKDVCLSLGDHDILKNININIEAEKISVILGKSGSGKTTLLNILNFLYTPDSGEVFYDGKKIDFSDSALIDRLRKNEISYFHQEMAFIENMSLRENLNIFSNIKGQKIDEQKLEEYLKLLGISQFLNTDISIMSGGERQRAAFLKLMLFDSSLILIDEPTNNLDDDNINYIMKAIKMLKDEHKTVLIVTHSKKILEIADIVFNMEDING